MKATQRWYTKYIFYLLPALHFFLIATVDVAVSMMKVKPLSFPSLMLTCTNVFWKSGLTVCQWEMSPFFLDSCPWKRMVFDRAADIFANITVISTGPNMTQFVCFFHIKEQFIPQCLHQPWANILIVVETSVFFFFSCTFAPSLRNPGRAESTRTYQAWRSLDHTQSSIRLSLPAQLLCLFYFYLPTYHLILVVLNGH